MATVSGTTGPAASGRGSIVARPKVGPGFVLSADPLPPDFDEQIEIAPMPLAEVAELALSGRLQDAKSNVAILRAQRFMSR